MAKGPGLVLVQFVKGCLGEPKINRTHGMDILTELNELKKDGYAFLEYQENNRRSKRICLCEGGSGLAKNAALRRTEGRLIQLIRPREHLSRGISP